MSNNYKNESIELLKSIGTPFEKNRNYTISGTSNLYKCSINNKIPLLYLENLRKNNRTEDLLNKLQDEQTNYEVFVNGTQKVSKIFQNSGIDHILFKTIKPYKSVPGDIDILIFGNEHRYKKAVESLLRAGYVPQLQNIVDVNNLKTDQDYKKAADKLIEPTHGGSEDGLKHISPGGTDIIDPETQISIDLQKELALSHVIYMDKHNFEKYIDKKELNGEIVSLPSPELDLAIVIAHSVIEQIFLLGEFYTFMYRLYEMDDDCLNKFIHILKQNKLENAGKSFFTISAVLCEEAFGEVPDKLKTLVNEFGFEKSEAKKLKKDNYKMPYKYTIKTLLKVFGEKMGEKRFRSTVGTQIYKMLNPKLTLLVIKSLIEIRTRESYLKNLDD